MRFVAVLIICLQLSMGIQLAASQIPATTLRNIEAICSRIYKNEEYVNCLTMLMALELVGMNSTAVCLDEAGIATGASAADKLTSASAETVEKLALCVMNMLMVLQMGIQFAANNPTEVPPIFMYVRRNFYTGNTSICYDSKANILPECVTSCLMNQTNMLENGLLSQEKMADSYVDILKLSFRPIDDICLRGVSNVTEPCAQANAFESCFYQLYTEFMRMGTNVVRCQFARGGIICPSVEVAAAVQAALFNATHDARNVRGTALFADLAKYC